MDKVEYVTLDIDHCFRQGHWISWISTMPRPPISGRPRSACTVQ